MFGWMKRKRTREEVVPLLVTVVQDQMQRRGLAGEVRLDVPLSEEGLGFDSVARLELLTAIEEGCGLEVPEKYFGTQPLRSLDHLLDVLTR